jgi:DNA-binding transcriptional MerR regulator
MYTVGEVAKLAHVSVRTLHHYDAIGLLAPSGRTDAGYRLYTDRDLERLQQVLFYRELGFALEDAQRMLDAKDYDRAKALASQRALLAERLARMQRTLALVDETIAAMERGDTMTKEAMFDAFADEAKAKWGDTPEYAEAQKRTKRYSKEDWAAIRAEMEAIEAAYAEALADGASPIDARARDLAERHRRHIDRWYYPCSRAMHAALGNMYVADARFAAHYDQRREGLAQFVCDAIQANAARG